MLNRCAAVSGSLPVGIELGRRSNVSTPSLRAISIVIVVVCQSAGRGKSPETLSIRPPQLFRSVPPLRCQGDVDLTRTPPARPPHGGFVDTWMACCLFCSTTSPAEHTERLARRTRTRRRREHDEEHYLAANKKERQQRREWEARCDEHVRDKREQAKRSREEVRGHVGRGQPCSREGGREGGRTPTKPTSILPNNCCESS